MSVHKKPEASVGGLKTPVPESSLIAVGLDAAVPLGRNSVAPRNSKRTQLDKSATGERFAAAAQRGYGPDYTKEFPSWYAGVRSLLARVLEPVAKGLDADAAAWAAQSMKNLPLCDSPSMRRPYHAVFAVASLVTSCDRNGTEARSRPPAKASDDATVAQSSHPELGRTARPMNGPPRRSVILSADYDTQCAASGRVVRQWGFPFINARRQAPTNIVLPSAIGDLSCSNWHSCASTIEGEVYCWGLNSQGQLGADAAASPCVDESRPCSAKPLSVRGLSGVVNIATFQDQTCAVTREGEVYCWGANTLKWRGEPQGEVVSRVPGLADVQKVAMGLLFACALDQQGRVWCWGKDDQGQLGRGAVGPLASTPAPVAGLNDVVDIAAGPAQACALTRASVYCWGSNDNGDLGVAPDRCGRDQCSPTPAKVSLPEGVQPMRLASSGSTCVTSSDGAAYCWGRGLYGAVGQPTETCGGDPCAKNPRRIEAVPSLADVSSGQDHVCGRTASNELVCWGTLGGFEFSGSKRDGDPIDAAQRQCAGCVGPLFRFQLEPP
jgi:hypothetical protein